MAAPQAVCRFKHWQHKRETAEMIPQLNFPMDYRLPNSPERQEILFNHTMRHCCVSVVPRVCGAFQNNLSKTWINIVFIPLTGTAQLFQRFR